ncbi:DUF960 family protein [Lysinibacillus sp. FSL M8-0355]|uniref:DUF960 family protein n=1 Tax=Lysinibacillus sp. FSL M8-0355 TaxID=2921719 RepID=UPI0030F4DE80
MTKPNRYRNVTRAISEKVDVNMQIQLWRIYDLLTAEREKDMDYLQVFEIKCADNNVIITNEQEEPALKKELILKQGKFDVFDTTIWIIDEFDKQTMLFPSDY